MGLDEKYFKTAYFYVRILKPEDANKKEAETVSEELRYK